MILVASALVVVGLFAIGSGRPALMAAAVLAFAAMNGFEAAAIGRQNFYCVRASLYRPKRGVYRPARQRFIFESLRFQVAQYVCVVE